MSSDASYEIFRKERDNTTVRVEAVKGIEEAQERVEELNRSGPGEYFIFDPIAGNVIEPSRPGVAQDPFAL